MATPQTIAFHTLGCKLNYSETSTIRRKFEDLGHSTVAWEDPANIYVLNTCSVTDFADRKCRAAVRKVMRQSPDAKVIVIGCYAQLKPKEIAEIPGVDLVLGAAEKFNIHNYVEGLSKSSDKGLIRAGEIQEVNSFSEAFSFGDRTRTFLKVQDGCDYKCTFCTIPQARGKSRSASIDSVITNANKIAEQGVKEVVLTGVNIGDFGIDISGNRVATFLDLIQELDEIEGLERIRISSIEPNLCSDEVIDFVARSKRFVPHFHMPLQSGSDKILSQMRRRYKRELYQDRVVHIKSVMPHCCIGVDVIVGFPSETEDNFLETVEFITELDVSYLHVFTYSERVNTLADQMEQSVPMNVRKQRNEILRSLSHKKKTAFYANHIGENRPVLVEKNKKGLLTGFTDNYIKVELDTDEIEINSIVNVQLSEMTGDGLVHAQLSKQIS